MEKTRIAGKKCSCCHHLNWWKLEITWSPFTAPRGLMSGHSPLQLFSDPRFGGQVLDNRQKLTRIACCDVKNLPNKRSGQEGILVEWMHSEWHLFLSKSMSYHIIGSILPPQKHTLHKPFTKLPWPLPWTLITFQWLKHPWGLFVNYQAGSMTQFSYQLTASLNWMFAPTFPTPSFSGSQQASWKGHQNPPNHRKLGNPPPSPWPEHRAKVPMALACWLHIGKVLTFSLGDLNQPEDTNHLLIR